MDVCVVVFVLCVIGGGELIEYGLFVMDCIVVL